MQIEQQELLQNYTAPRVHRIVWHSLKHQQAMQPALDGLRLAYLEAERKMVVAGFKRAIVQAYETRLEYEMAVAHARNYDLFFMPLAISDKHSSAAITKQGHMLSDPAHYDNTPICCMEFWQACASARIRKPIYQWAMNTPPPQIDAQGARMPRINGSASIYANPMLFDLSIRFTPHFPCAPDCASSIKQGELMRDVMNKQAAATIVSLLESRIIHDEYRGIAQIHTEPFRLITTTHPTRERFIVTKLASGNVSASTLVQLKGGVRHGN